MPAVKRSLDVAELVARRRPEETRPNTKRLRITTQQDSHALTPRLREPRTPLADITPPGSATEFTEAPSEATAAHCLKGAVPKQHDNRQNGNASGAAPVLSGVLNLLTEDEVKGLLLAYASSYKPLADAVAALVSSKSQSRCGSPASRSSSGTNLPSSHSTGIPGILKSRTGPKQVRYDTRTYSDDSAPRRRILQASFVGARISDQDQDFPR